MGIYDDLGIKPIINASATLTKLGGSRMPGEVLEAMHAAAGSFIDLPLFQTRVGDRIAELTRNDAAFVSSGAAAGIVLSVARAVGEFGAVSVVSGRVAGETMTLPLLVQQRFENFDVAGSYAAAALLAVIALLTLAAMTRISPRREEHES